MLSAAIATPIQDKPAINKRHSLESIIPRLKSISRTLRSKRLKELIHDIQNQEVDKNRVLSCLMVIFRDTRSIDVYNLLFNLSYKSFLALTFSKLKRYGPLMDPQDIIQEVYISIFRYPRSFREDHSNSFRNWSYTIIRNAIFKISKKLSTCPLPCDIDSNYADPQEKPTPLDDLVKDEKNKDWTKLYCMSLSMYLHLYNTLLNAREKIALHRIEVLGECYKDASEAMGVKLANFKMIVCRARKKIFNATL